MTLVLVSIKRSVRLSANNLPRRNRDSIVLDITKYSMKDNRHWTVCIKAIKIRLWLIHFKVINSCFSLNIRIMKVYRGLLVIDFLLSIRFPPLILFEQDRLRFCNSDSVYKTRNMSNKQFFINIFDITVLGSIELISCKHLERILFTSTFQNFNVDQHRVNIISSSCAFFLV